MSRNSDRHALVRFGQHTIKGNIVLVLMEQSPPNNATIQNVVDQTWWNNNQRQKAADQAHVKWVTEGESAYWAMSDQIVNGVAQGSKYYPRCVSMVLWL